MPMTSKSPTRRATALALSTCLVGAAAGVSTVATAQVAGAQQASVRMLEAKLRPSGDPDGAGEAAFKLYRARGKVCAQVTWRRIATPNAAHIHRHSDGQVVVDLTGSVTGGANCAKGVSKKRIGRILDHPRRYYFNVHNTPYPAGAIQGTLHR